MPQHEPILCHICASRADRPGETFLSECVAFDGTTYTWVVCQPCRFMTAEVWAWRDMDERDDDDLRPEDYQQWATRFSRSHNFDVRTMAIAFLKRTGLSEQHSASVTPGARARYTT